MIIDTHSHIYAEEFAIDAKEVLEAAKAVGVEKHVLCNVDKESLESIHSFCSHYPDYTYMAMGLHPTSVGEDYKEQMKLIGDTIFSNKRKYVAIGEVGLDLYWDDTYVEQQLAVFEQQVDWSIELGLPLVIHARKAYAELFRSLKKFNNNHLQGVFHCFGGGIEEARKAVSMGFYLGIGGVVTYKNSNLGEVIEPISIDRLMMETDAPYLSPVPYRGKRNEPKYLTEVRDKIASIYNVLPKEVEEITSKNACELFSIAI